jgi:large subunit ribosomal protein L5
METIKKKIELSLPIIAQECGITNKMASPKIVKVVIASGIGRTTDKKKKEYVLDRITKIAAQKATFRKAKKSIATFKLREGDPIGVSVTLRGPRMYAFLDKLVHISIPRMRDFQGLDPKAIDDMGNVTIGIPEHTIFPETSQDEIKDMFGLAITIVTSAKDKRTAEVFLRALGLPFKGK